MRATSRIVHLLGLLVVLLVEACAVGFYQLERDDEPATRRWVQRNAVPARLEGPDIPALARAMAHAKVVAVGEATHGTHEFAVFRARLFQQLVEHHGFRVFALEAGFGESMAIDRYVTRGVGDPEQALADLRYWPWYTREMLDLVEWIRAFNRERPPEDQVRFYGFDMQTSAASRREACDMLRTAGVDDAGEPCAALAPIASEGLGLELSEQEFTRANALAQRLAALVTAHEAELRARVGDRGFALARAHVEVVRQSFAVARNQRFDPRDTFMAANLVFIEQLERKPVFVWAHNGHLARSITRSYKNRTFWTGAPMGDHLAKHYARHELVVVGAVFTTGRFNAIKAMGVLGPFYGLQAVEPSAPMPHSFDGVLASSVRTPYALDLRKAEAGDPDSRWFHKLQHHREFGAGYFRSWDRTRRFGGYYSGILPAATYDWVIVFGPTTPTRMLRSNEADSVAATDAAARHRLVQTPSPRARASARTCRRLLAQGQAWDFERAFARVSSDLVARLSGEPWKGV